MDAANGGPGDLEDIAAEHETAMSETGPGVTGNGAGLETAGNGSESEVAAGGAGAGVVAGGAGPGAAGSGAGLEAGLEAAGDGSGAGLRVSDRERDVVVQRVQAAFAEGRLDDTEFDERMRAALTARTRGDLDVLLTDLPAETAAPGPVPSPAAAGRGPGRLAIALKSSVRRGGRWRVPERYTTVVYKGSGWLDLRAAELSGPVTTFVAVAYKSRVTILVPPGVRVEMTGFGVTQGADEEDPGYRLPTDAPVIHVRGVAYKGTVEITTRPPERPALHR
jgi:hypothetical protein